MDLHLKCTTEEVKKRYKQLAVMYHPDKNVGDSSKDELFKDIIEAYKILSNDNWRKEYDKESKFGNNYDVTQALYEFEFSNTNNMYDDYSKKFNEFKSDSITDILIKLKETDFKDSKLTLTYKRKVCCKKCLGLGKDFSGKVKCYICKGVGENREGKRCSLCVGEGYITSVLECDMCDSTGMIANKKCFMCKGEGKISTNNCTVCEGKCTSLQEEKLQIKMNDFIEDKCIFKGKGHYSPNDEIYGGLYLLIEK